MGDTPVAVIESKYKEVKRPDLFRMKSIFQVGGLTGFQYDYEIPLKYGVDQCIGDTLGPGGINRGSVPTLTHRRTTLPKETG